MTDTTIVFAEAAKETISRMREQAVVVDAAWGRHRPELARKTTVSLGNQLAMLVQSDFGTGTEPMRVYRDDQLSLLCVAGITFGVIFHPSHYQVDAPVEGDPNMLGGGTPAPRMGRYCFGTVKAQDDDHDGTYCMEPFRKGEPTCTGHETVAIAMPVPGEWSFHS